MKTLRRSFSTPLTAAALRTAGFKGGMIKMTVYNDKNEGVEIFEKNFERTISQFNGELAAVKIHGLKGYYCKLVSM